MAKQRLFGNRKAEVPDFISDIFSFFLYMMFFMMFFIIFTLSFGGCNKFTPQSQAIVSEWDAKTLDGQFLLNYLRTNLSVDSRQTDFARLISDSCLNDNYEVLREKTKELMSLGVNKLTLNQLSLRCNPEKAASVEIYKTQLTDSCPYHLSCSSKADLELETPLPPTASGASYAIVGLKECRFLTPEPSRPIGPAEREIIQKNIERCVK
jgi:hypothetical protein